MVTPTFVESSNIECLGHENDTLFIRFKSGESYAYSEAARGLFQALCASESVGKAFHRMVKGKLHYRRLDRDPFGAAPVTLH